MSEKIEKLRFIAENFELFQKKIFNFWNISRTNDREIFKYNSKSKM